MQIHSKNACDVIKLLSMHHKDKLSQHSSTILPVWLNGIMLVYKLSDCGFESRCSYLNSRYHTCFDQQFFEIVKQSSLTPGFFCLFVCLFVCFVFVLFCFFVFFFFFFCFFFLTLVCHLRREVQQYFREMAKTLGSKNTVRSFSVKVVSQ